ncbi:hypothetical protein GCM10023149_48990 [Mucilaginibacter gynuensis]|uniref:Uncharacterized protein n=1 Tax=Mucilaginibacter gynuensis TaxID=1302236 RepID=A0ABP8HG94_9SPHI
MKDELSDEERERLEDEAFAETGSCSFTLAYDFDITEQDLTKQLVKDTEGKSIKGEDLKGHQKN